MRLRRFGTGKGGGSEASSLGSVKSAQPVTRVDSHPMQMVVRSANSLLGKGKGKGKGRGRSRAPAAVSPSPRPEAARQAASAAAAAPSKPPRSPELSISPMLESEDERKGGFSDHDLVEMSRTSFDDSSRQSLLRHHHRSSRTQVAPDPVTPRPESHGDRVADVEAEVGGGKAFGR